jgi:predicted alpha/beta hydrolase
MRSDPGVHDVSASDGWRLSVLDYDPGSSMGIVVAGHAMMADRQTLCRSDRPTLVSALFDAGFRVLVPDLRGHGKSGPRPHEGGDWGYDDLVDDTRVFIDLAHQLDGDGPLILLGHSLFGHTSLAYLGMNPDAPVDAVVAIAVHLWRRADERGRRRRLLKDGLIAAASATAKIAGYIPTKRLGFGSADESRTYWRDFTRFYRSGTWGSSDGVDYRANLANVRCPVLHVLSDGDSLYANPEEAIRFLQPLGERREVLRLGGSGSLGELTPDHMGLVTRPSSAPVWVRIAEWMAEQIESG